MSILFFNSQGNEQTMFNCKNNEQIRKEINRKTTCTDLAHLSKCVFRIPRGFGMSFILMLFGSCKKPPMKTKQHVTSNRKQNCRNIYVETS